jgi:hypothetical protein
MPSLGIGYEFRRLCESRCLSPVCHSCPGSQQTGLLENEGPL